MTFDVEKLEAFAAALLAKSGMDVGKADIVARLLVRADTMGHTTHGLAQLDAYLAEIESGRMLASGDPEIVSDRGAAVVWDGRRLPGVWLTAAALDLAIERAKAYGICAISIRRSHHIACLASFLPAATPTGMMAVIMSSDPSAANVAPFGGRQAVFTPDPIAIGIPTEGDPIFVDTSTSITTIGMSARLRRSGERFPGAWAINAEGAASNDPNVLSADLPGALLPTGGLDHGHKGYGLALMVEALTQGLSGYGRADDQIGWGASVFVQVYDPAVFAGLPAFQRQTEFVAAACRASPPISADRPVRLPGANAVAGMRNAAAHGISPDSGVMTDLRRWAGKLGLSEQSVI